MSAKFFYDLSSPYAYLAARRIDALLPDAEWQPIAFGIILRETGRVPWSLGPAPEADFRELSRRAAERGLPPLRYPDGWPRDSYSLAPLRAAVYAAGEGRIREFTLAAYDLEFAEGRVLDASGIAVAASRAGLDPDATLAATEDERVKASLKAATDEAISKGVEGVPAVLVGEIVFWGDDRLEDAAAAA